MINSVVLVGRLTRDPEMRQTGNGTPVCSYTLAVNRRPSANSNGPEADFINCVAWNKTAETMSRYLHKGSLIGIEGRIQTRNYENQQGQRVYVTEVVTNNFSFLESKNAQRQEGSWQNNNYGGSWQNSHAQPQPTLAPSNPYAQDAGSSLAGGYDASETLDIASDDLPF